MNVEIIPCTLKHIRELAANLRPGDRAELEAGGRPLRHLLIDIWMQTDKPRCALVDGKVAACWGLNGSLLATEGSPWLFTTPEVEKRPIQFLKQTRQEVREMLKHHHTLVSGVAADYTKAHRFFELLGFSLGKAYELGPDGKQFRELRMGR